MKKPKVRWEGEEKSLLSLNIISKSDQEIPILGFYVKVGIKTRRMSRISNLKAMKIGMYIQLKSETRARD